MTFNPRFDPSNPGHTRDLPNLNMDNLDWNDPASIFGAMGLQGGPGSDLPIPKMVSPTEIKKQAREYSAQIFKDHDLLNAILDRHEPTIHKRWAKKTKKQRAQTLLGAWPNMSATHRPDFQAFKRESEAKREAGTSFRDAYMWPYINLEDLSKPKTLLLFLQARARNTPDAFAFADADAAHMGYVTKAIVPPFLNEYTMMLMGRKTPDTYGELLSWDDHGDAFEWMTSGKGFLPGHGLTVLEMQQRVFRFLVDCCKEILHDIPDNELTSDKFPSQQPVQLVPDTAEGFASRAVMASEAPYRSPANLDLMRLESLLAAKKSAAEDHIWAMREDPGYYAHALLECKEHRREMLKDTKERNHPALMSGQEGQLWERVIKNVVANAHMQLEVWSELLAQVQDLRKLQTKYEKSISVEKDLPEEYLDALLRFQHYLKQAAKGPQGILKHHAVASPPLRQYYAREPPKDPTSTQIAVVQKAEPKHGTIEYDIIWLLRQIWEDGHALFLMGLPNAVDELERLTQSDKRAKEMLSPFIAETISDLAVIAEATRQLRIYQPWAQTFENRMVEKEKGITKEFAQNTRYWGIVMAAVDGTNHKKIVRLGEPEGRKFYYPVDKNRKKEHVEAMLRAEEALDAFWLAVDQNMRNRTGNKLQVTALGRLLSQPRILERTTKWAEHEKGQQKGQNTVTSITMSLSELDLDRELRTESTIDRSSKVPQPEKTKKRGRPSPPPPSSAHPLRITQDVRQPTFALDERPLKVFRTLFHTPSVAATPGEISWSDFLNAMGSTGFDIEKLYGSVWHFRPTNLDVERSIQFHEPHPAGKLPYTTARRFGRRLNRAYGWEGSMFVPKEE